MRKINVRPNTKERARILTEQNARCIYCGLPLLYAIRKKGKIIITHLEWDHFIPYAYNYNSQFVCACNVCNRIKHDKIFDSIEDARKFILARRKAKQYFPVSYEEESDAENDDELVYWNILVRSN
jgi:hypothetical protein